MTAPHEQKLRVTGSVVGHGNRVGDGKVVYRLTDGKWTTLLGDAAVIAAERAREALSAATADEGNATGVYLAPVTLDSGGHPTPANLRERIRSFGPTVALPTHKAA